MNPLFEVNSFQIPNALVDELLCELSGNELKCYLIIVRKTKGWQKEEDAISLSQFESLTGLSRNVVINSCKKLEELGLVESRKGFRNTTVYWLKKSTSAKTEPVQKMNLSSEENELVTSSESEHTKDTIKNTTKKTILKKYIKKDLDLSAFAQVPSEQVWIDYLEHRKNKKAKLTQTALDRLISEMNRCLAFGYSIDDVLAECMARGWIGFKCDWITKQSVQQKPNRINAASGGVSNPTGFKVVN